MPGSIMIRQHSTASLIDWSSSNLHSNLSNSTWSLCSNASTLAQHSKEDIERDFVFCLTRQSMLSNTELMEAIQHYNPEYILSETEDALTALTRERRKYYFICDTFQGDLFNLLRRNACRICAPPLLINRYRKRRSIPQTSRPLFNGSMFGVVLCFSGYQKDEATQLCELVHYMGGSVRKDFSGKVMYLVPKVAQGCGSKYKTAVNLAKHILHDKWIYDAWDKRFDLSFKATSCDFVKQYIMKPFHGLCLSFVGFPDSEKSHMEELTVHNGGSNASTGQGSCTHLVVEESAELSPLSDDALRNCLVVKQEWFWASIQLDACADESLYFFTNETTGTPLGSGRTSSLKNKRKLNYLSDISDLLSPDCSHSKRRSHEQRLSTVSSATFDSSMGSPLSVSRDAETPDRVFTDKEKKTSKRHQVCLELLQTERNYVDVLKTLIKVFKVPIEDSVNQRGGALLVPEEVKMIFGPLPDILDIHQSLQNDLETLLETWHEEQLVGKAVADKAEAIIRAYPQFVNYFEMIKETISKCDKEKPRFHAFLKIALTRPECGRQTLTELLIRPVQRLPSMSLLINDILKHTPSTNKDHTCLLKAAECIKSALTHINEDKRRTEGQVQMFEIVHEIDNCPPYLLSAQRSLVGKADMFEVTDCLGVKSDSITMFLFNDSLEIAKKNKKVATGSLKSPALQKLASLKLYKHLQFFELARVKGVVDVKDGLDLRNMFGLIYTPAADEDKTLFVFSLIGEATKAEWMKKLATGVAKSNCASDIENLIIPVEPQQLLLDDSDLQEGGKELIGTLSKAFKKTKGGIGRKFMRAFSVNKTPKRNQGGESLRKAFASITPNSMCTEHLSDDRCVVSPTLAEVTMMNISVCDK